MNNFKVYENHLITAAHLARIAAKQEDVFLLDSCQIPDAMKLGKYQVILGVGAKEEYRVPPNQPVDWKKVDEFGNGQNWCFCLLGYDLKNEIYHLSSKNVNTMNWPDLVMIIPETVITLCNKGILTIWAERPDTVFLELHSETPSIINHEVQFSSIRNSMSKLDYLKKVEYIKDQIANGDVYEMNLCMEYVLEDFQVTEPIKLFEKLIANSPSPFSAYVKLENIHILCASPERFLTKQGNQLYSQPIKGTAPRFVDIDQDNRSKNELKESTKERAEHVMIVDLVRNDLSKCAKPGTTKVPELFEIYGFAQVFQMISTIQTELLNEIDFSQIIQNTFPMGSMTGAPKKSAMEYIEELETVSRGNYSGSIGYIEPNGNFDFNVVIRSLLYDSDKSLASFSVGGAITYDSDPNSEFEECQLKASGIRRTLGLV